MRLVEPTLWVNLSKGYKISRYEVRLEQFDPKFFSRFTEEFLMPHYSPSRYQWGAASLKPKIVIKMADEYKRPDEDVQTEKYRSFELFPLGLQKSDRSETATQSYEVEYSALEHFLIGYVQISGRRRIDRFGYITPSEVQPFLLV
ncbi:MAG: hypothetical protein RXR06_10580 [Thermoproteus sp.]